MMLFRQVHHDQASAFETRPYRRARPNRSPCPPQNFFCGLTADCRSNFLDLSREPECWMGFLLY